MGRKTTKYPIKLNCRPLLESKDIKTTSGVIICEWKNGVLDSYKARSLRQLLVAYADPKNMYLMKISKSTANIIPMGSGFVPYLLTRNKNNKAYEAAQELNQWLITNHGVSLGYLTSPAIIHASKRQVNSTQTHKYEAYTYTLPGDDPESPPMRVFSKKACEVGLNTDDAAARWLKQHS
jgi:hypothetical protein